MPTKHVVSDGVLYVWRSENERRVLIPLLGARVAHLTVPGLGQRVAPSARAQAKPVLDWIREALACLDRTDLDYDWRTAAITTQWHRQHYAQLNLTKYRCVVVPRQSHPYFRALIEAASEQGVPTIYLPHSPLTYEQMDLPVSHAGMRGAAEVSAIVAATGADPHRISVVGNPSTNILGNDMPALDRGMPGVLALAPVLPAQLTRLVELVTRAGLQDVIVAPHPRTDLSRLRQRIPRTWSIHSGARTSDLLRKGHPWLLQSNSGSAWEAAALGIPTANIRLPGDTPVYPFLEQTRIPNIDTPEALRAFIGSTPSTDRAALRHEMLAWCATDGERARLETLQFIACAEASHDTSMIADEWAPGGTRWERSQLTWQKPGA